MARHDMLVDCILAFVTPNVKKLQYTFKWLVKIFEKNF